MNKDTLLHRQINPNWVQNNVVTSQAFINENESRVTSAAFYPYPKDNKKLSVYNGEKFTAEEAYEHFTKAPYKSIGVMSITVNEVETIDQLSCDEDNDPFDGHAIIDYSEVESKNQIRKKAIKLREFAANRGWTFQKIE